MRFSGGINRPPYETADGYLQTTEGCSHNHCLFCTYFKDQKPVIYISLFLKKNQIEYYDRISEVRRNGNYEQWISFFLEAVSSAAKDSLTKIKKLSELHDRNVEALPVTTRKTDNTRRVFDYVEKYPIIDIKRTAKALGDQL